MDTVSSPVLKPTSPALHGLIGQTNNICVCVHSFTHPNTDLPVAVWQAIVRTWGYRGDHCSVLAYQEWMKKEGKGESAKGLP